MKKNYFLAMLFAFAMVSVNINAQDIDDDMESYAVGQPIFQDHWTDWGCGGGAGCAIMSSADFALSGAQSGLIPDDGTTDAVLDLGNKIFDVWGLAFYMYVPSNQEGYFNLQGEVPIGAGEWIVGNIHFNQDLANPGVGLIDNPANGATNFDFPHDAWFPIVMNFDISSGISAATWSMHVDGAEVIPADTPFTDGAATVPTSLGGIDFFSINTSNIYYIDDVFYIDEELDPEDYNLGTSEFAALDFRTALNNGVLTFSKEASNVSIYNMLGQEVYRSAATTSNVDMSSLANGTYIVKVNIDGIEGSVKVVK